MNQTESIQELATALSKAQGQMKPAIFNKVNPHFKNKYADFTSVMDACRIPLSSNGLSVMQYCENNGTLFLVTMLAHCSGQWIKSYFPLNSDTTKSQALGSALTYAKRYALAAMLGIVADDDDDDAESASTQEKVHAVKKQAEPKISDDQARELEMILGDCEKGYQKWVYNALKSKYNAKYLSEIPLSVYESVKADLVKNMEINRSQQNQVAVQELALV